MRQSETALMTLDMDDRIRATLPKDLVGKVTEEDWERIHNMEANLERARKEDPDEFVQMMNELGFISYQGERKFLDIGNSMGLTEPVLHAMQVMYGAGDWMGDPTLKEAMRKNIKEGMEIEQQYLAPFRSESKHDRAQGFLQTRTDRKSLRHAGFNASGRTVLSMFMTQFRSETISNADNFLKGWLGEDALDLPGETAEQLGERLEAVRNAEFLEPGSFYNDVLSEEERNPLRERERKNWSEALTGLFSKPK